MTKLVALGAAVLLGLSACTAEPASNEAAPTGNEAAPVADNDVAAAPAAERSSTHPEYFVGRWTRRGDCSAEGANDLRADGTMWIAGENVGGWSVTGDRMNFEFIGMSGIIERIDDNMFQLTYEDSETHRMTRC